MVPNSKKGSWTHLGWMNSSFKFPQGVFLKPFLGIDFFLLLVVTEYATPHQFKFLPIQGQLFSLYYSHHLHPSSSPISTPNALYAIGA